MRIGGGRMVRTGLGAALLALSLTAAAADPSHLAPTVLSSGVVINIPQRRLFLMSEGRTVVDYPVALGRPDWPTFVGPFTVIAKEVDPVWDVPISIQEEQRRRGQPVLTRVAPGPNNPLGKYWLGLSAAGYGIHGTNAPATIPTFQTHGCIRMLAPDIKDLFARVEVGTVGMAIYEPILVALLEGDLWMESHPDIYKRDHREAFDFVTGEAARLAPFRSLDVTTITRMLVERDGVPRRIDRPVAP